MIAKDTYSLVLQGNMNIYKQIFKVIKKYDTIVIARHIGADPDL